jgi:hypothetical protein
MRKRCTGGMSEDNEGEEERYHNGMSEQIRKRGIPLA